MDRLKVGILYGGRSEEHSISVKSAQEFAKHLDTAKYEPFYVRITEDGAWNLSDNPHADWDDDSCRPAILSPDSSVHGLLVLEQGRYKTIRLDLVLPVLHGNLGEDGVIQGLLELSGVPYAGCDVQSSALCMDKSLTYLVARDAGVATPEFRILAASGSTPTSSPIPSSSSRPVRARPSASVVSTEERTCWAPWTSRDDTTRRC